MFRDMDEQMSRSCLGEMRAAFRLSRRADARSQHLTSRANSLKVTIRSVTRQGAIVSQEHSLNENVTPNSEVDQYWADLLSPARRRFILKSGLMAAASLVTTGTLDAEED